MRTVLAAALVLAAGGTSGGRPESKLQEYVTARLVRVPVILQGDCRDLAPGSIAVDEDGLPVGPTYLDPDSLDTVHAILIDAGPGMLDNLRVAREAATAYVRSLPPGEPALLATFDHRMLLHAAWSTDRERFEQGVGWIEVGAGSHLWASTRKLIDYLRPRFARKALILVTRGCDTEGPGGVSPADVAAAADKTESLSIFPIAVGLPARCESTGVDPLAPLLRLAERTGGELFRADDAAGLAAAFRTIRERLGREVFVLYTPPPFGAGPKDKPAKFTSRWRKLHATASRGSACRVTVAGAPLRCESAPGRDDCAFDGTRPDALVRPFEWSPGRDALNGQVRDIVRDGGVVAPSLDALLAGALSPAERQPQDQPQTRPVSAYVPALDELVQAPGAEGVVLHMLARAERPQAANGTAAPQGLPARWSDEPFLVNGEVLSAIREPLGRALAGHPDYLAWATERARADRLAALDDLIRQVGPGEQRTMLERARGMVAEKPVVLEPREMTNYLGAWLGDIPAARAFQFAEASLTRRLLSAARAGGRSRLPEAWTGLERSWARFGRWVPPPDDVRLLAWLVPGYDEEQKVVGYYRVVLAQPFAAQMKNLLLNAADGDYVGTTGVAGQDSELFDYLQSFNFSRDTPLGARLLRWMLEQDDVARQLLAGFDVEAVRYAHSDVRDLVPTMLRLGVLAGPRPKEPRPARQVTLVLKPSGSEGPGLPIGAYFELNPGKPRSYDQEPLCLVLFPEHAASAAQASLLRALAAAQRRTPCVL